MASHRARWLAGGELLIGAVVTAVLAVAGVAGLPTWAIILASVGVSTAGAAVLGAFAGRSSERVLRLSIAVGLLGATLVGSWVYYAIATSGPEFVNFIPNQDAAGESSELPRHC